MAIDFDNRVICEVQLVNIKVRYSETKNLQFQAKSSSEKKNGYERCDIGSCAWDVQINPTHFSLVQFSIRVLPGAFAGDNGESFSHQS